MIFYLQFKGKKYFYLYSKVKKWPADMRDFAGIENAEL